MCRATRSTLEAAEATPPTLILGEPKEREDSKVIAITVPRSPCKTRSLPKTRTRSTPHITTTAIRAMQVRCNRAFRSIRQAITRALKAPPRWASSLRARRLWRTHNYSLTSHQRSWEWGPQRHQATVTCRRSSHALTLIDLIIAGETSASSMSRLEKQIR